MPPILIALLTAIVPVLVNEAEKLFDQPKQGVIKHAWVKGAVEDLVSGLIKRSPPEFAPALEDIASLLEHLIESKLQEIDP